MTDTAHGQGMPGPIPGLPVSYALTEEIRIELRRAALQARSSAARIHGGGGFRARRSQRLYRRFLAMSFAIMVLLPMACISAYLWAIPAHYVTQSRLSVVSQSGPMKGLLSSLMGQESSGEAYLMSYIESSNIIAALLESDRELIEQSGVLRENPVVAAVSRTNPSLERQLELWTQHVIVRRRSFTGTIELSVSALTAQSSLDLHARILELSEQHINLVSERRLAAQVSEAERAVQAAQVALSDAVGRLQQVRQKYNMLDPELEATQRINLIYALEQQQSDLRQRLQVLQQNMPGNPQIEQLSSQIEALESQKQELRQSIAGDIAGAGATVAQAAAEMALFTAQMETARGEVARRMVQLSEARQSAGRQGTFLQNSVSPVLPQSPYRIPKVLYWIMFLAGTVTIWLGMAAMGALVRDHAG